jgi:hypothetical protein
MKKLSLFFCLPLALGSGIAHSADLLERTNQQIVRTQMEKIKQRDVSTADDLVAAVHDKTINRIVVVGELAGLSSIRLLPGQALTGGTQATLRFKDDSDGIQLSSDNELDGIRVVAASDKRAIFNDTTVSDFGRLELQNLALAGLVQLLAADSVRAGHVEAHNIDIVSADARAYKPRPKAYGVEVITGAFTLWNQQLDPSVTVTADLIGISVGRPKAPVRGSGIFVSGAGDTGGRLLVGRLETGAVYTDAGIVPGTADRISGGIFTCYGAVVDIVQTHGSVTTYGPNDMALDNWGAVDRWISEEKITSYGPSGIGFVNFGDLNSLKFNAPIETFGQGARGFNVYAGTVKSAEFDRIVTRGNGAVGIQIGRPVGEIRVLRGIETFGGTGESLVKGVMTKLSAIGFSVKSEGSVRALRVDGGLRTHAAGVPPLELQGDIESLVINDGVSALAGKDDPSQQ